MAHWPSVLRPGDWVHFDGGEHQVVALTGTSVRLCSSDGAQMVVLATHLMGAPGFGVIDGAPLPQLTPFGLLDSLPATVMDAAQDWERHIVEVTTGVAPEADRAPGIRPRDPTQPERDRAKAAELAAAGRPLAVRTLQRLRARYASRVCGAWSISECCGSGSPPAGSTRGWSRRSGTSSTPRPSLDWDPVAADPAGEEVPRAPTGRAWCAAGAKHVLQADRRVGDRPAQFRVGGHPATDGEPPAGPFTPTLAARPGEQVQIDSTPLDVMVLLEAGVVARADLTIAVDVATRTICAAVLRPIGTKAVDAALLLARMLVRIMSIVAKA